MLRFWLLRCSCPPPPPVAAGEVFVLDTVDLVRWFQPVVVTWLFSNAAARAFVAGAPPEWLGPWRFELHRAELTSCPGCTYPGCLLHMRGTRKVQRIHTPIMHYQSGRRRFMYSVVKDFNELSQNIRHLVLSCYKSELRQHLLSAQATYLTGVSLIVVWIFCIVFPGLHS